VDHPRYGVKIDVSVLACDTLRNRDPLLLGFVRKHRPANDIADSPDIGEIRPTLFVDGDEAALVLCQADRLGVESRGMRQAADRDDQLIERRRFRLFFRIRVLDGDVFFHADGTDQYTDAEEKTKSAAFDKLIVSIGRLPHTTG